jgi:hypothetical protein
MSRRPFRWPALIAAALVVAATGCGEPAQGPIAKSGVPLALAVGWPGSGAANAIFGADIDQVQVIVSRQNESTAVDTTFRWSISSEELRIAVEVPLEQRVETLYVNVGLYAGQSPRFYGGDQIILRAETVPPTPTFELFYVGPGSDAVFLTVTPRGVGVGPNGTLQMSALVQNGQGLTVTPPIGWSVSDTRLATIGPTGLLRARGTEGVVQVRAATPTGLTDSVAVVISTIGPQSP